MKLDQLSDASNRQLYALLQGIDVPEFVKDAELDDHEAVEELAPSAFADQVTRSFPIDTPARVYISNAFYQAKKAELEDKLGTEHTADVGSRIKSAGELFSITSVLEAYNESFEKRASADYEQQHVCVIQDDLLGQQELFPYKRPQEFVKSAEVFAKNLTQYPFEWREQISKAFLAKAAEVGVDELPDVICKYAGLFLPDHTEHIAQEITRRANKLTSKVAKEQLTTLSSLVAGLEGFESIEDVMKIAQIVYHVEQADGAYDRPATASLLPDPVDTFFANSPEKTAELLDVIDMGGEKYAVKELKKISADRYKEAFGIDIDLANDTQLREVLPTLPLSDVSLFRELTGIEPV